MAPNRSNVSTVRLTTVRYMNSTYHVTMNHESARPLRKYTLQMYHMMKRGMLVSPLRMSMMAKLTIRIFGTVRNVLNRINKIQIMPLPKMLPIIAVAIIKVLDIKSEHWQNVTTIVSFISLSAQLTSAFVNFELTLGRSWAIVVLVRVPPVSCTFYHTNDTISSTVTYVECENHSL